jgi:hypothetical protein
LSCGSATNSAREDGSRDFANHPLDIDRYRRLRAVVADMIRFVSGLPKIRALQHDALLPYLISHVIETTVRHPTPVHLQPAFVDPGLEAGRFPVAEALAGEPPAPPIRPRVPEEIAYITATIGWFWAS